MNNIVPIDQFIPEGAVPVDQFKPEESNATLKAAAQGAAEGFAGPLGTAALRAMGQTPEELRQREEAHPVAHTAGEIAGFIPGIVGKAGIKLATKVANTAAKRAATEGALYGLSNELSKLVKEDPNQTMATAAAHIGLGALLAGAAGKGTSVAEDKLLKTNKFIDGFKMRVAQHMSEEEVAKATSATDRFVDDLVKKGASKLSGEAIGATSGAVAGGLFGHPIVGAYLGKTILGPHMEKILPSLIKPLIKHETSGEGLSAATEYLSAAVKGAKLMGKATKDLFEGASKVLPEHVVPSKETLEKMKESVSSLLEDPFKILNENHSLGHYLPDHASIRGETLSRAVAYLDTLRPDTSPHGPLGEPRQPSKTEEAKYNQALIIAEQPLMVLQYLKEGSLTSNDLNHLDNLWPSMRPTLQAMITKEIASVVSKEGKVPYNMVPSLSLFMGMPLESSTLPYNMSVNQQVYQPCTPPQEPGRISQPNALQGRLNAYQGKSMQYYSKQFQTSAQSREQNKGNKP